MSYITSTHPYHHRANEFVNSHFWSFSSCTLNFKCLKWMHYLNPRSCKVSHFSKSIYSSYSQSSFSPFSSLRRNLLNQKVVPRIFHLHLKNIRPCSTITWRFRNIAFKVLQILCDKVREIMKTSAYVFYTYNIESSCVCFQFYFLITVWCKYETEIKKIDRPV